ncbi:MAG: DUF11 domain-containing protein [Planctomycetes bacterium]|nr:DUF11 domain-containing protein [Planctomycetota bacterium]
MSGFSPLTWIARAAARRRLKRGAFVKPSRRPSTRLALLGFETLESRVPLAVTNLGAIEGRVYDDATGNGYGAGEEIAGAAIQLFQDDGDGVFDAGDTNLAADLSDANGMYRFDGLTAGNYFVRQPAQVIGADTLFEDVSALITISSAQAAGTAGSNIDTFNTTSQAVTALFPALTTDSDASVAPESVGGERDLYVELTSASGTLTLDVNGITTSILEFQASATATGTRLVTWDGADSNATTLDPIGLGGIDLTDSGDSTGIELTVGADQNNGQITVNIHTDGANYSTAVIDIPNTGGAATETVYTALSSFAVGGGTGADFTNVGAIELRITGVAAVDGQLDLIRMLGPTVTTRDFANFESADLSVAKTVDDATPDLGGTVVFTITVSNAGPDGATGVTLLDTPQSGLTYVSSAASQGSYDSGSRIWTVGSLANGSSATLAITMTVDTLGAKVNSVEVDTANEFDVDSTPGNDDSLEDDWDSVAVTPRQIDLSVTKTSSSSTPTVGSNVAFQIGVANGGPDSATGVSVRDALPAGLTFVSGIASQGSYDNGTGVWTVGTLTNGGSATLQVIATVTTSGTKTNTAQVSAANEPDADSTPDNNAAGEDDQASVEITSPPAIDLSLTKSVDTSSPNLGDNVTFTIALANAGPDTATGVDVEDVLPSGLTFVGSTPSQGSYDRGTGVWSVGAVASGGSASLQIVASVDTSGDKTNTAQVRAAGQDDIDSTPDNDAAAEDDQDSVVVSPPRRLSKRLFMAR